MPLGKIKQTEFNNSERISLNKVQTDRFLWFCMHDAHCLSHASEDSPCCSANIEYRDSFEDCPAIRGRDD